MKNKNKKLAVYILLDRSGSMGGAKWENAISSINQYALTLDETGTDADITVAAFDSTTSLIAPKRSIEINKSSYDDNVTFELIRDSVSIKDFGSGINCNELQPRGSTPLYDATAKLLNLADKNNSKKTVIIIITDGAENYSKIYNITSIKDRIATCQNRGWEVIFLGAEFNADNIATSYGLGLDKVVNNVRSADLNSTMRFYASSSSNYMSGSAIDTSSMRVDNV